MATTQKRKKKAWSRSFGEYGHKVRIFEDPNSKIIYAEVRDPTLKSGYRCRSLRHRDKEVAERWAKQQALELLAGNTVLQDPTPTVSRVLGQYLKNQTPTKCPPEQKADRRRTKMWLRFLGPKKDLSKLTLREWWRFITDRRSGAIDASGNPVPEEK